MTEETPELNGLKWWIFREGMRKPIIKIDIITIASLIKPLLFIPETSQVGYKKVERQPGIVYFCTPRAGEFLISTKKREPYSGQVHCEKFAPQSN